ncbi:hypothetical protein SFC15_17870 [Shouchella clausii]
MDDRRQSGIGDAFGCGNDSLRSGEYGLHSGEYGGECGDGSGFGQRYGCCGPAGQRQYGGPRKL